MKRHGDETSPPAKRQRLVEYDHNDENISCKDTAKPDLVSIPAEVRAMILRYCLHSRNKIDINLSLEQPALLRTFKLIREEALPIWYKENRFSIKIYDYDSSLLEKFKAHENSVHVSTNLRIYVRGPPHWQNLVKWCRAVYTTKGLSFSTPPSTTHTASVISAAHELTRQNRQRTWEDCEKALGALRMALLKYDVNWA